MRVLTLKEMEAVAGGTGVPPPVWKCKNGGNSSSSNSDNNYNHSGNNSSS